MASRPERVLPDRRGWVFLVLSMLLICGNCGHYPAMASDPDPETSVCGALHEPLAFWRFRRVAGRADASRVAGIRDIERDRVVRMAEVEELMRVAHSRGARVLRQRELAHPFQDATRDIHLSRFQAVADFLAP